MHVHSTNADVMDNLDSQRLTDVKTLVKYCFDLHGLTQGSWTFSFDNCVSRAGCCDHSVRHITLSKHLALNLDHTIPVIKNILLHEIAHALVGAGHGHGDHWKRVANLIGCDGNRCHHFELVAQKYVIACAVCGYLNAMRHRVKYTFWRETPCHACLAPNALFVMSRGQWEDSVKDTYT